MANDEKDKLIEIRTFASMAEIRALPGFKENNGVTKENYDCLFGDYWFANEEKCCFQKPNGHLCGEDHKSGFVARLKDTSLTIIGNICARDKFGADAKIKADRSKYLNEKRRRDTLTLLEELLKEKQPRLQKLELIKTRLNEVEQRIGVFIDSLGERTARRLRDMARSGNNGVFVDAITYKEYTDDEGNKRKERRVSPTKLGSLNGLSVINEFSYYAVEERIRAIRNAYQSAESLTEGTKTSELERIAAGLGGLDRVTEQVDRLERDENAFFESNLLLLCFLVDDKSERYKASKIVLERSGESAGKDKAKAWLAEQERQIRTALKAERIGIQ